MQTSSSLPNPKRNADDAEERSIEDQFKRAELRCARFGAGCHNGKEKGGSQHPETLHGSFSKELIGKKTSPVRRSGFTRRKLPPLRAAEAPKRKVTLPSSVRGADECAVRGAAFRPLPRARA